MVLIASSVFQLTQCVSLHSLKQILKQNLMQKDFIKRNAHVTEGGEKPAKAGKFIRLLFKFDP